MFVNSKINCVSTTFKEEISILSLIEKSYRPGNICKTAFSSQKCVKNTIQEKNSDYFDHKFYIL